MPPRLSRLAKTLAAPWREAQSDHVSVTVRNEMAVELDDETTLRRIVADGYIAAIKDQLRRIPIAPKPETRARRKRALRSPNHARYRGSTPDPAAPYGYDSGYLHEHVERDARGDITVPKSRELAITSTEIYRYAPATMGRADRRHVPAAMKKAAQYAVNTKAKQDAIASKVK